MNAKQFGKVAVLLGGRSAEREVSLMSGKNVLEALQKAGVDAHAFDPAQREIFELEREGFQRVFIALHGRYGEDGTVQGALELMGIPYTGSGVMASALCMDKVRTKMIWVACGLPTPRWEVLHASSEWREVAATLGLPLIVKPAHEGSTIGLTKVTRVEQLPSAYELAVRSDPLVLAEEFVAGMELTAGFLGDSVLPLDPHRGAAGQLRLPEQVLQRRDQVFLSLRPARSRGAADPGARDALRASAGVHRLGPS